MPNDFGWRHHRHEGSLKQNYQFWQYNLLYLFYAYLIYKNSSSIFCAFFTIKIKKLQENEFPLLN
jgi:hypothetical protein